MRLKHIFIVLSSCLLLAGCGTKKSAVSSQSETPVAQEPTWHTCLIQGARATLTRGVDSYAATVTMQTVRDSMLVISVMPLLGMELMRVEATPFEMIVIDKFNGRYAKASFTDLNRKLTPSLNWDVLQQLCSAELPTGDEKARLFYSFGAETIELVVDYTPRKLDVPVKVTNQRLNKYTQIDISKWL